MKSISKTIGILFLTLFSNVISNAQIDSNFFSNNIMDIIDEILEDSDDENAILTEDILETLSEMSKQHINLNALSYETAIKILHWSDYQYYQLQLYIEKYGQLVSLYEISAIPGFSEEDIFGLQNKVYVESIQERQPLFKNFFKHCKNTLMIRYGQILEKQAGYDTTRTTHYEGSPGHACFKYTFSTKDKFILNLSGEKDAGEAFFRGEQKYGFDFYSGSICLKDLNVVKKLVLGDYRLDFGQGLLMGSSLLSGRGSGANNIRHFSNGIRAIAPINEGDFLRGFATTLGNSTWSGSVFGGRQFGGIDNHFGGDLSFRQALFKIGVRFVCHTSTDTSSGSFSQRLKSDIHPNGFNIGVDYQVLVKHAILWGEVASDENWNIGLVQNVLFNLTPTSKLAIVFRHYDNGFSSPLGKSFAANSQRQGETGIYATGNFILGRKCEAELFMDYYRLSCPSYRTDAPIQAFDIGATARYSFSHHSVISFKYTFKNKPRNNAGNPYYKEISEQYRHKINCLLNISPYLFLKLKTGLGWTLQQEPLAKEKHSGFLIYQDAAITVNRPDITLHFRLAFFDTDRYDERLYAYEDDVYYAFTIGSYYYKGIRGYLVLHYKYKCISLWLRLAQTYFIDREIISSGLTEIDEPHKTDIKVQFMFSL